MGYSAGNVLVTSLHVLSVILAVGGMAFLRFVALPFAEGLPEEEKARFQENLRTRFFPILSGSFALLMLTGLHHITRLISSGMAIPGALIAKIVLALVFIIVGVALTIPNGFPGMEAKRKSYLSLNLLLAAVIVFLGIWVTRHH